MADQIVHEYDYEHFHVTPVLRSLFRCFAFQRVAAKVKPRVALEITTRRRRCRIARVNRA